MTPIDVPSRAIPSHQTPVPDVEQRRQDEVIVRTVNVHVTDERYKKGIMLPLLYAMAKKFHADWRGQVGLIGVTEPKRHVLECMCVAPSPPIEVDIDIDLPFGYGDPPDIHLEVPATTTGTHCLAAALGCV